MAIWADQMPTTTNPNRMLLSDLELPSFIIDEPGPISEPLQDADLTVPKFYADSTVPKFYTSGIQAGTGHCCRRPSCSRCRCRR